MKTKATKSTKTKKQERSSWMDAAEQRNLNNGEELDGGAVIFRDVNQTGEFIGSVDVVERAEGADENRVDISISSEDPVMRWGEPELLSHDDESVNLKRLRDVGAVLRNHDPDQIVGKPENVRLENRRLKATIVFGTTEIAKQAKQEVMVDQTLRGVSVGYIVKEWVYLKDSETSYKGRFVGPAWVASKWDALEASLTPIPADGSVGVGRSVQSENNEEKKEAKQMPKDNEIEVPVIDVQAERDAAMKLERQRVGQITKDCGDHSIDSAVRDELINSGKTIEEARGVILAKLSDKSKETGTIEVKTDGRESFARAAMESINHRRGKVKIQDMKEGRSMVGLSLVELARESLRQSNHRIPTDKRDLVSLALRGPALTFGDIEAFARGEIISGSSSDFPYLLAATAYKSILDGVAMARVTYPLWCKIGNVSDFKSVNRIKLSEVGDLQRVYENGKYQDTAISEDQNAIQVVSYGLKWNMSRVAIINDDLDAFTSVPMKLASAAARLPNQLAVAKLLENPTLNDGVALFAGGHSNYSASASYAPDTLAHATEGLKNLIKTMQLQKAMMHASETARSKSVTLGIEPAIVLAGPTGQFTLRQASASGTDPSQSNSAVPSPLGGSSFRVVTEALLEDSTITGYSTTAYYGFAMPMEAPVIEVAFLNGVQEPYFEETDQVDADGRIFKIRHDVGVAAIDYVGGFKENGA